MTLILDDLKVEKCAHAQSKPFPFCINKDDKNFSINFLRYVSWYKYLIVGLVFSHLGFWSGNLFLIAPFPDLCLLVPFYRNEKKNILHDVA